MRAADVLNGIDLNRQDMYNRTSQKDLLRRGSI